MTAGPHIHRQVIHHGAEIALLRDLYLRESTAADGEEPVTAGP